VLGIVLIIMPRRLLRRWIRRRPGLQEGNP
jgi:hypothetical protein